MGGLAEAKADLKLAMKAIAEVSSLEDLLSQLRDNVLPAVEGLADAAESEFAGRDEVIQGLIDDVDELVDDRGEVLQPESTTKLLSLFALGEAMASELEKSLKKVGVDEVTKKRVGAIIKSYRQGVLVMSEFISEITVPLEDDDPDAAPEGAEADASGPIGDPIEGDDDDDDDGDEGDDDDDGDEGDDADDEDDDAAAAKGKK